MRIESSVTTLSWIPSEAVTGVNKGVFEIGFTHYDEPPPDVIDDLDALREVRPLPVREPARAAGSTSRAARSWTRATAAAA